jgi:hypothetical protein
MPPGKTLSAILQVLPQIPYVAPILNAQIPGGTGLNF